MLKKIVFFLSVILSAYEIQARINPTNNAVCTQSQIMFEIDEVPLADSYLIMIYIEGESIPFLKIKMTSLAHLLNKQLEYNKSYSWYYIAYKKGVTIFQSEHQRFSTKLNKIFENNNLKIEIKNNQLNSDKEVIFLDGLGVATNYKGDIMWHFNNTDLIENSYIKQFRNIQISPQGTITTLLRQKFYDFDLFGKVLWVSPVKGIFSNDSIETYHHDGKRLKNNNYMLCSYRFEKEPCQYNDSLTCIVKYGTLLELNNSMELIWKWSEQYNSNLKTAYAKAGIGNKLIDGNHLNGFDFNENNNTIITSFRDNNRILIFNKENYGTIVDLYGDSKTKTSFYYQHSPQFTDGNSFVFYNNNVQFKYAKDSTLYASICHLKLSKEKVISSWNYTIKMQDSTKSTTGKEGYAQLLPDNNYLITVGSFNKILIVSPKKKIVWEATITGLTGKGKEFEEILSYRTHYYSSLYPRYFTVQSKLFADDKKNKKIKINNEGTDDDVYEIVGVSKKGVENIIISNIQIKASQSKVVTIPATKMKSFTKTYTRPMNVKGIEYSFQL